MHDELKMIEIPSLAFPIQHSISMKKFTTANHHYTRSRLAPPHISNEQLPSLTHEDERDSKASSKFLNNIRLLKPEKNVASVIANNITLPSPPSSTRSSFDNDVHLYGSGEEGENGEDSHHASDFGTFTLESNEISPEQPLNSQISQTDEVKLVLEDVLTQTVELVEAETRAWNEFELNLDGVSYTPNGVRLVNGVSDLSFYREPSENDPLVFTNQLSHIKMVMTKFILRYKTAIPFLKPVDSVALKIPHYYRIIRDPMDLNTIKNRLHFFWYRSAKECLSDFDLIFKNCFYFNSPTDYVYIAGRKLQEHIQEKFKQLPVPETQIPCPEQPSLDEVQKICESKKRRSESVASDATDASVVTTDSLTNGHGPFAAIKMTTRSERGVMVRKPSKDLPATISTPQSRSAKKVPLNEPLKNCLELVRELFNKKHVEYAWPFYEPVDTNLFPDYLQKIKKPIDLSKIKMNIETGKYITVNDFANDMRLMFSNCLRYNQPGTPVIEQARKVREVFEFRYAQFPEHWLKEKLVLPSEAKSRTSSPSLRLSSASPMDISSLQMSFSKKHKHSPEMITISRKGSHRRSSSNSNLNNSMFVNNVLSCGDTSSDGESRMKMLEMQVARLTNALTMVVNNDAATNLIQMATTHIETKPRKRGPAKGSSRKPKTSARPTIRKRKRHLSSDEDSDFESDSEEQGKISEPFNPTDIEDLKKLKSDLENLPAADLQSVLKILQNLESSVTCDSESNVEIDFEQLKPKTLCELRKYVTSCTLNSKLPSTNLATSSHGSTTGSNVNKKFCHSSNASRSNNLDTDCDNSSINWSRAGSRASNLQLSESSSSDSELD